MAMTGVSSISRINMNQTNDVEPVERATSLVHAQWASLWAIRAVSSFQTASLFVLLTPIEKLGGGCL